MAQKVDPVAFVRRFETLKTLWFRFKNSSGVADEYDRPPAHTRQSLMLQFEQLGVELPMHPKDQPILIGRPAQETED